MLVSSILRAINFRQRFPTDSRSNKFYDCLYSVIRKDDNANGPQIANRPSVYIAKRY